MSALGTDVVFGDELRVAGLEVALPFLEAAKACFGADVRLERPSLADILRRAGKVTDGPMRALVGRFCSLVDDTVKDTLVLDLDPAGPLRQVVDLPVPPAALRRLPDGMDAAAATAHIRWLRMLDCLGLFPAVSRLQASEPAFKALSKGMDSVVLPPPALPVRRVSSRIKSL